MLFNSIEFLIYFPAVFILYWLFFADKIKLRNFYLIVVSYIFYGWWDWRFLFLIIISSYVDYYVGKNLYHEKRNNIRKRLLFLSIAVNLGFLGFFKYFNFFADSFVAAFTFFGKDFDYSRLKIILPVGISFYTFQTMSYTFDVYRNKMKPTKSIIDFFAFVSFFPQLVAGPIERASNLLPQFEKKYYFDYNRTVSGFRLILWGMFKKVVVADRLSAYVDAVYNNIPNHSGASFYVATLFFAFQIYCDFSGYSDIAIGTARAMGFNLMTNFKMPYFAVNFKDFWNRWHISLSTWFRDYFYIPIGGNRCSKPRQYFNLFATFVVSGLWHGANWTFVFWGALHGVYQIIEKMTNDLRKKYLSESGKMKYVSTFIKLIVVFHLVNFAWIFFRADNLQTAFVIVNKIFSQSIFSGLFIDNTTMVYGVISIFLLLIVDYLMYSGYGKFFLNPGLKHIRKISYAVMVLYIIATGVFNEAQFIYFQF